MESTLEGNISAIEDTRITENNKDEPELTKNEILDGDQPTFDKSFYVEVMNARKNENHMKNHLKTQYPKNFVIWHCLILIVLSCGMIAMQIIQIIRKTFLHEIATGIWNGALFLILALMLFILNKTRNYYLYRTIYFMHIIAILLSFATLFLLPLIASSSSVNNLMQVEPKLIDDYYATMIVFSVICDSSCLLFLCIMNCAINRSNEFGDSTNQSGTYKTNMRTFFTKKTIKSSKHSSQ